MSNAQQTPEQQPAENNENTAAPAPVYARFSRADLTALGLLTDAEIGFKKQICRVIAVEDGEDPKSFSITTYDGSHSPNGVREEYNLVAKADRDPQKITSELTIEAQIYSTDASETTGIIWPFTKTTTTHHDYFTLTATGRNRNEKFDTRTTYILSAIAEQDPADEDSFIVTFANRNAGSFKENMKPISTEQIVHGIRNFIEEIGSRMQAISSETTAEVTTTNIGPAHKSR